MLGAIAVAVLVSAAPEPGVEEFCAEFGRQATRAKTFSEALAATAAALPAVETPSTFSGRYLRELLLATARANPDDFLWIAREVAASSFQDPLNCAALKYPAGRPAAEALLREVSAPRALAAEAGTVWLLACARERRCATPLLTRLTRTGSESFAVPDVNSLALGDQVVFLLAHDRLLSMPKAGGPLTEVLAGLTYATSLVRDGDSLLFVDSGVLKRVPVAGGPARATELRRPRVPVPPKPPDAGEGERGRELAEAATRSSSATQLAVVRGVVVVMEENRIALVKDGRLEELDEPPGLESAHLNQLSAGPRSVLLHSSGGHWELDLATRRFTRSAERWTGAVAAGGGWIAVSDPQEWPGKRKLVRIGADGAASPIGLVGTAHLLAVDGQRVYWVDEWWGRLMALPR